MEAIKTKKKGLHTQKKHYIDKFNATYPEEKLNTEDEPEQHEKIKKQKIVEVIQKIKVKMASRKD